MKIGIITFHNSDNYGAVLQTLALQKKLSELNNDVYIINYICKSKINMYKIFRINKNNSIKSNIRAVIDIPFRVIKRRRICKITKTMYNISNDIFYSSSEIEKADLNYDIYICGSDQVWNYENTKFDKTYFLNFEKKYNKKMSYAASFGINQIDKKYEKEYIELINEIKYLSVREETGKNIIKNLTNRECEVVLDPTLLLNQEKWISYTNTRNRYKNYILLYSLNNKKEIYSIAKKLSNLTGCRILQINTGGLKDLASTFKNIIPNPLEFVNLINGANYIITDSFHGTAFSVNLNKNFFVYLGKGLKSHSRIIDLLTKCGLTDRIIIENKELDLSDINYNEANKILESEREKSMNFIINSLTDSKNNNQKKYVYD